MVSTCTPLLIPSTPDRVTAPDGASTAPMSTKTASERNAAASVVPVPESGNPGTLKPLKLPSKSSKRPDNAPRSKGDNIYRALEAVPFTPSQGVRTPTPSNAHGIPVPMFSPFGPPIVYPESPNTVLRQTAGSEGSSSSDSSAQPMSPHGHPMPYSPYVMYHPMYPTEPSSPHSPPSPLMGSPVSTPTAMMFPQTPFAGHSPYSPFHGGAYASNPFAPDHPLSPAASGSYFHPIFNSFPAFIPPVQSMAQRAGSGVLPGHVPGGLHRMHSIPSSPLRKASTVSRANGAPQPAAAVAAKSDADRSMPVSRSQSTCSQAPQGAHFHMPPSFKRPAPLQLQPAGSFSLPPFHPMAHLAAFPAHFLPNPLHQLAMMHRMPSHDIFDYPEIAFHLARGFDPAMMMAKAYGPMMPPPPHPPPPRNMATRVFPPKPPRRTPQAQQEPKQVGTDGLPRLNARQRRTLRRAKERAIKGLMEAGHLLIQKHKMPPSSGAASGGDSSGSDTEDSKHPEAAIADSAMTNYYLTAAMSVAAGSHGPQAAADAAQALCKVAADLDDMDIGDLIQQLSARKEEGVVDDNLIRDLQIIKNLIGALKIPLAGSAVAAAAAGSLGQAGKAKVAGIQMPPPPPPPRSMNVADAIHAGVKANVLVH